MVATGRNNVRGRPGSAKIAAPKPRPWNLSSTASQADTHGRHGGITRQALDYFQRQVNERNAGGGQGIVFGRRPLAVSTATKQCAMFWTDILGCLRLQVSVKSFLAAAKRLAVMLTA